MTIGQEQKSSNRYASAGRKGLLRQAIPKRIDAFYSEATLDFIAIRSVRFTLRTFASREDSTNV
jgi:hypothetical protein